MINNKMNNKKKKNILLLKERKIIVVQVKIKINSKIKTITLMDIRKDGQENRERFSNVN